MSVNEIRISQEPFPGNEDPIAKSCEDHEPYVLMNIGDSMEPEFRNGDILVIEPGNNIAHDGCYVIAHHQDEYIFRQFMVRGDKLLLNPLNSVYPVVEIDGIDAVKGVIIQRKRRGIRNRKNYLGVADSHHP